MSTWRRWAEPYFWSTYSGVELDLLLPVNGRMFGVEVKYSEAPVVTKSMRVALDDLRLHHLYVVHPGRHRYPVDERITAWPIAEITALADDVRRRAGVPRTTSATGATSVRRPSSSRP